MQEALVNDPVRYINGITSLLNDGPTSFAIAAEVISVMTTVMLTVDWSSNFTKSDVMVSHT